MHGDYIASDTNYIAWRADTTAATFANGNVAYHASGGVWTADTDDDFLFAAIEDPAGTDYYRDGSNIKISSGKLTAIYYTSIKNIGYICDAKIMIESIVTINVSLAWDSDAARKFDDSATLRFTGEEAPGALSFQVRTSTDNVTWSGWLDWITADYNCRYFQIKMTAVRESVTTELIISNLTIKTDLPDIDETQDYTISVAATGAAITFVETYHEPPAVNVDILSGAGIVHIFSVAPTITDCTIKHLALDGTAKTGTGKIHAHGI